MATFSSSQQRKLINLASNQTINLIKSNIKNASHWFIFPFPIVNGDINITETGYKANNANVTDFGSFRKAFNGGAIQVQWENSCKAYQKNKGEQFSTMQYKVGTYWDGFILNDESEIDVSSMQSTSVDTDFKTLETKKNYTLLLSEERFTTQQDKQFYVVLNDNNENIGGISKPNSILSDQLTTNQSRIWLLAKSFTNYYDRLTNKFIYQQVNFGSINDLLDNSAENITTFIQTNKPGEGYPFPKIINKRVDIDLELLRDVGVQYAGLNKVGASGFSSIYFFGRPTIKGMTPTLTRDDKNNVVYEKKVYPPRIIVSGGKNDKATVQNNGGVLSGFSDPLAVNSHPTTTMYSVIDAVPTGYENYKDWNTSFKAQNWGTDAFLKRDFNGMISFDKTKTFNSNHGSTYKKGFASTDGKAFYDSEWVINDIGTYETNFSTWFNYKKEDGTILTYGKSFTFPQGCTMSAILAYNALLFSNYIYLPIALDQFLPFQISQIPIYGKFLNSLTLGTDPGTIIQQKTLNLFNKINFFTSKQIVDFVANDYGIFDGGKNLIPLNFFKNSGDEIGDLLGASLDTQAYTFKLTDRMLCTPIDYETGLPTSEPINTSTVNLSQKITLEDGKKPVVFLAGGDNFSFQDITTPFTYSDNQQLNPTPTGIPDSIQTHDYAYIIDAIIIQDLYTGNYRISFYEENPFTTTLAPINTMVWQAYIKSASSLSGNLLMWTTFYKTGIDPTDLEQDTDYSYPASILPITPQDIAKTITLTPDFPQVIWTNNDPCRWAFRNGSLNPRVDEDKENEWLNLVKNISINFNDVDNNNFLNINDTIFEPNLNIKTLGDLNKYYDRIQCEWEVEISVNQQWSDYIIENHTTENIPSYNQPIYKREYPYDTIKLSGSTVFNISDITDSPVYNTIQKDYGVSYIIFTGSDPIVYGNTTYLDSFSQFDGMKHAGNGPCMSGLTIGVIKGSYNDSLKKMFDFNMSYSPLLISYWEKSGSTNLTTGSKEIDNGLFLSFKLVENSSQNGFEVIPRFLFLPTSIGYQEPNRSLQYATVADIQNVAVNFKSVIIFPR